MRSIGTHLQMGCLVYGSTSVQTAHYLGPFTGKLNLNFIHELLSVTLRQYYEYQYCGNQETIGFC